MKKSFKLQDLDCANCAAKMERKIAKIEGVTEASVNFMAQRLTIEADENRFDEIVQEAIRICRKVEPDCKILL
ncbi:MAG: heavy-metal-associated domain-containing protein [Clostridiales bacterium]|nr:heavy-metal-associated domain-containing protein [Clostridiales bacterium]